MKSYVAPRLNPGQLAAVERGDYDFLILTRKPLMRTDEVAIAIHRSLGFVRALIEDGRLEKHRDSATGERCTNIVTRRSVILYLVETGDYSTEQIVMRIEAVMKTLTMPALDRLIAFAQRQKNLL